MVSESAVVTGPEAAGGALSAHVSEVVPYDGKSHASSAGPPIGVWAGSPPAPSSTGTIEGEDSLCETSCETSGVGGAPARGVVPGWGVDSTGGGSPAGGGAPGGGVA